MKGKFSKQIPNHAFSGEQGQLHFQWLNWSQNPGPYEATRPHRHMYNELLFFLKGKGKHEVDFTTYLFKPFSVHFVKASTVHAVSRQKGSMGFSLLFSADFCNTDVYYFFQPTALPLLNLGKEVYGELSHLLVLIQSEYNSKKENRREIIQALFNALLMMLNRRYAVVVQKPAVKQKKPLLVQKFEQLIEEHYSDHWRVASYADALNTSVANLSAQCRKHNSQNAQQCIHQRILLEIKRLLAYSDKSVKEICFHLNFEDPAYFNRFFRKYTGLTPLQYKHALKK